MTERLIEILCYLRKTAISSEKMMGDGRMRNDWIFFNEEW